MSKEKEKSNYDGEAKTSLVCFLSEAGNYAVIIATAIATLSVAIFMDVINSTCNFLRAVVALLMSLGLKKNQKSKYNYGTDNIETLATLLCDSLLVIGTSVVVVIAIMKLIEPTEPSSELLFGVLYKALCVLIDGAMLYADWKVLKKTGSKVARNNFESYLGATGFDFAIFVSVLCSFLFRGYAFVIYVEPIISIAIAVYVIPKAIIRIKSYIGELSYKSLDEKDQMKITTVLAHHFDSYEDFISVSSHKSGKNVCIDFMLSFPDETTYAEIVKVLDDITKELDETFESCKVSLVFDNKALSIGE